MRSSSSLWPKVSRCSIRRRRRSISSSMRAAVANPGLSGISCSVEALSFEQVRRWFDLFPGDPARLVNMYGITETTVHVSFRELDRAAVSADDGSLIGRPLSSLGIRPRRAVAAGSGGCSR